MPRTTFWSTQMSRPATGGTAPWDRQLTFLRIDSRRANGPACQRLGAVLDRRPAAAPSAVTAGATALTKTQLPHVGCERVRGANAHELDPATPPGDAAELAGSAVTAH